VLPVYSKSSILNYSSAIYEHHLAAFTAISGTSSAIFSTANLATVQRWRELGVQVVHHSSPSNITEILGKKFHNIDQYGTMIPMGLCCSPGSNQATGVTRVRIKAHQYLWTIFDSGSKPKPIGQIIIREPSTDPKRRNIPATHWRSINHLPSPGISNYGDGIIDRIIPMISDQFVVLLSWLN
jgi:hypothetical protein